MFVLKLGEKKTEYYKYRTMHGPKRTDRIEEACRFTTRERALATAKRLFCTAEVIDVSINHKGECGICNEKEEDDHASDK